MKTSELDSAPNGETTNRMKTIIDPPIERLAVDQVEARRLLGGISRTCLWRIERQELLRSLPGLGRKYYSVAALRDYVEGKTAKSTAEGGAR